MSLRLSDHQVLHNVASSSSFLHSLRLSLFFRSYFVLPNIWSLRNLIKQLFHSRLLDMTPVIANSALRASLAIYHLISNARSWNNCYYSLRASAWETGADLEMKVGRFRLKLVHKVLMSTYVICQSFSFNDFFLAEFWISAPQESPEADFQCNFGHF